MSEMRIAQEIQRQLGHKALYMMGAKQLLASSTGLTFKIGKNAGGYNKIRINLVSDLYVVEFLKIVTRKYMPTVTKYARFEMIWADQLHQIISSETGFALSLSVHYADYKTFTPCSTEVPQEWK